MTVNARVYNVFPWVVLYVPVGHWVRCCEMARSVSALELLSASFIEGGYPPRFHLLLMFFFVCFCFMSSCKTKKVRDVGFSWRWLWCLLPSKITMKVDVVNSSETLENCHAAGRQIPENSFRKEAGSWGNWLWPYLHECCSVRHWVQNPLSCAFRPKLRMHSDTSANEDNSFRNHIR